MVFGNVRSHRSTLQVDTALRAKVNTIYGQAVQRVGVSIMKKKESQDKVEEARRQAKENLLSAKPTSHLNQLIDKRLAEKSKDHRGKKTKEEVANGKELKQLAADARRVNLNVEDFATERIRNPNFDNIDACINEQGNGQSPGGPGAKKQKGAGKGKDKSNGKGKGPQKGKGKGKVSTGKSSKGKGKGNGKPGSKGKGKGGTGGKSK